ncbi:MAG: phosphatidate cytidylyltransferase [Janthinobacterium lividum]
MTRVLTAVVLLAVLLPVTFFAPLGVFGAMIAFVIVLAAWEWGRLLKLGATGSLLYAALAAMAVIAGAVRLQLGAHGLFMASALFWLLAVPFAFIRRPQLATGAWRVFLLLAGLLVFVACWQALVFARLSGVWFVVSLLLVVWLADIGAYFSGRRFGRHKLAPSISPGKTWEGACGGWLLTLLVALLAIAAHRYGYLPAATIFSALDERVGIVRAIVWITLLVAFSISGDLFESLLKRQAGVKDSSNLLPGHGGVLDRVDALLPVLPIALLFFVGRG